MYGISFGNEKVQKWVTSLLVSVLSSVFITQPIQVTLTAIFFVSIFRKANDFYQEKVKDENKIDTSAAVDELKVENPSFGSVTKEIGSTANVEYIRKERLKERKLKMIIKKLVLNSIFLWILYLTAFSNRDLNSFRYQNSLRNLIVGTYQTDQSVPIENVKA